MIISAYDVTAAARQSSQKTEVISLRAAAPGGSPGAIFGETEQRDTLDIARWVKGVNQETEEKNKQTLQNGGVYKPPGARPANEGLPQSPLELKLRILQIMLEALTGRKIQAGPMPGRVPGQAAASAMPLPEGAGRISGGGFQLGVFSYRSESVSYSAAGAVKTADGKTISFDISMRMSRETASFIGIASGSMIDPLVISYGGTAASLTGEKFQFDLACSGSPQSISFPGQGSGFLVYNRDGDGIIKDGSQLFGPQSGNGFEDLRRHDIDGNGWIDEADDIFKYLMVWAKDKDGNDQMFTLKDLGIGAIFLGETQTQFSLDDASGNAAGQLRSTSFFLRENGTAGTISHIDLLV